MGFKIKQFRDLFLKMYIFYFYLVGMRSYAGRCQYGNDEHEYIGNSKLVTGVMECYEWCISNSLCTAFHFFKSNVNDPGHDVCELYKGGPYTYGDGTTDGCGGGCNPATCYVIPNGKTILKI